MKFVDLSKKELEYTVFIPTHVIHTNDSYDSNFGEWKPINPARNNWLDGEDWMNKVTAIIKISDDLILVVWSEVDSEYYHTTTLYKGILTF